MVEKLPSGEVCFPAKVAAQRLGMSVKTLTKHIREGRLRYCNIGTGKRKQYRFTDAILLNFLAKIKTKEVPQCPSTNLKSAPFGTANSKSTVVAFTSLPKPQPKKPLWPSKLN